MDSLTILTGPAEEPISLGRAKAHLRIDHDDEDENISAAIKAAREYVETYCSKRLVTQTYRLSLPGFPAWDSVTGYAIRLPIEPVVSVESVKYYNSSAVLTTLASNLYQTWLDTSPPLVAPAPLTYWPLTQTDLVNPVRVEFTAGGTAANVPERAKQAMLLMLGYWDQDRGDGDIAMAAESRGMPAGAQRLLTSFGTGEYLG